jgi:DnaJ-class molecular chaperone
MSIKNYYILLGISSTATAHEIKAAYRELAKKYHPDKNQGDKNAEEHFKEIQQAYTVLSNPEKRKKYDLKFFFGSIQTKQKTKTPYTGNAYQYAQQQAQQKHQFNNIKSQPKKKTKNESHQILISIGIALILLYFIISYNTRNKQIIPAQIPHSSIPDRK